MMRPIDKNTGAQQILSSRKKLLAHLPPGPSRKAAQEGGCGVVGLACTVPIKGKHVAEPAIQMHNRGNGKGGGVAAAGLRADQFGVDADTLRSHYIIQVAMLDPGVEAELEQAFVNPHFDVKHKAWVTPAADYRDLGMEVKPPDVLRYFVRVKDEALVAFAGQNGLTSVAARAVEDEFIYQNSFRLNRHYYASLGEKRAFVLSHARNLVLFKIVGYAEQVLEYYGLGDAEAQLWMAHQRYPTKGRVWHPGGSHPFIGMNEALVHNGDFANYYSVCEYLRQQNVVPQFLTDTEVAALLFDLWRRVYGYPLEYVIEAMAPTTELDFQRLPVEKQRVYRAIQAVHMHGSPDGPWFFIIARSDPDEAQFQLLGVTDTSMLRPQVFALQEGEATIGLIASEKQAIDAALESLSREDGRFRRIADRYWNARGGSHTDGGAFSFTVTTDNGVSSLVCADKFGREITAPPGEYALAKASAATPDARRDNHVTEDLDLVLGTQPVDEAFLRISQGMTARNLTTVGCLIDEVCRRALDDGAPLERAIQLLTRLNDRRYDCGTMKRSAVLELVRAGINRLFDATGAAARADSGRFKRIDWATRHTLASPSDAESVLTVFARDFPAEGEASHSRLLTRAYELGWKRFIVYGLRGQRFTGCAFGPGSDGVRIDVYGSSGDYLGSGIDGLEIHVHGDAQDQLAQIMKSGRLVVHGSVGQTFMYGAKGGEAYILGNAAGRPLINAVGRPRVVINGTCLDYLAESFMAGDPHEGGGFAILNGIEFDDRGRVQACPTPYPGSNLFSLASGGALFVRDPFKKIVPQQLNGGEFTQMTDADWDLIRPYLETNEKLFGISVERDLLDVDGSVWSPLNVYRKIRAVKLSVLAAEAIPE